MTIHAQLSSTQQPAAQAEPVTDGLAAAATGPAEPLARLDPRTRRETIAAEQAPPGRYLEIETGQGPRLIPLIRPIVHIGRGLTSDVRLEDPQVSRRHAIIAQRGDGVRVLDDRSSNGTIVNGQRVEMAHLTDGDVLRVGGAVFRFVEVPAPGRRAKHRRSPGSQAPGSQATAGEPPVSQARVLRRIPLPVRASTSAAASALDEAV